MASRWQRGHDLTFQTNGCARYQWRALCHCDPVELKRVAKLSVQSSTMSAARISPVNSASSSSQSIASTIHSPVDPGRGALRRGRFEFADIGFPMDDLALQVRRLDPVSSH